MGWQVAEGSHCFALEPMAKYKLDRRLTQSHQLLFFSLFAADSQAHWFPLFETNMAPRPCLAANSVIWMRVKISAAEQIIFVFKSDISLIRAQTGFRDKHQALPWLSQAF